MHFRINFTVALMLLMSTAAHGQWTLGARNFYPSGAVVTGTSVAVSGTVQTAGIDRPGINLGGIASYGNQQLLKSLNYGSGGYMPGQYFTALFNCSGGGTQTTANWYNNVVDGSGFPANFWAGATYTAVNAWNGSTAAVLGTGTITASTSNVSSGANFTLSSALSSACNTGNPDVLIVKQDAQNTIEPPTFMLNVCPGATWDTTDTSPASTNTIQSLEMPTTCNLTYYMDATMTNRTNTNGYGSNQVVFLNLNGSYNATFKAKCVVSGCGLNFSVSRLGGTTFVGSTNVSPAYSATAGAGWTTYTYPFTGTETGSQSTTVAFGLTCTGTCLVQDVDVVEGSTLSGNTTAFRDAVVWELEQLHPGSIRYMDASQWCSDVADEIAATGNRRWCDASAYLPQYPGQAIGYNDVLQLANVVGSDAMISVGQLNGPSDWTTLVNWLNSSGWISTYATSGHKIYLEMGNENWNGVSDSLANGNGTVYGLMMGLNMAAAKAASGYNSSVIKLVGNSWVAANQGYGGSGWLQIAMTAAHTAASTGLPDFVDVAPYMLNNLGNFATSGSNVATTGAPFLDEWAEDANIDSLTSPPTNATSMYLNQTYAQSTWGVGTLVYEVNESTISGITATQTQLNQVSGSVGQALSTAEHVLLMQRDSGVTGPIHVFTLAEPYTGYTCSSCGTPVTPLWGSNLLMSTGPGQTAGVANVDRPLDIALRVINNAIGSNNNLMSVTQSGTPTFSYTAGQDYPSTSTPTILANSAVPYVNCTSYANSAKTSWTSICFNNNLTTAESVTFSGAGAPSGTVTETIFPNSGNIITDNNENTFLGTGSSTPLVAMPTSTSTSGLTYSIPAASFITLTYSTSVGTYSLTGLTSPATVTNSIFVNSSAAPSPASVKYYVDGALVDTETSSPFWLGGGGTSTPNGYSTSSMSTGTHTLLAASTTSAGATSTSTVTLNVVPSINSTFSGGLTPYANQLTAQTTPISTILSDVATTGATLTGTETTARQSIAAMYANWGINVALDYANDISTVLTGLIPTGQVAAPSTPTAPYSMDFSADAPYYHAIPTNWPRVELPAGYFNTMQLNTNQAASGDGDGIGFGETATSSATSTLTVTSEWPGVPATLVTFSYPIVSNWQLQIPSTSWNHTTQTGGDAHVIFINTSTDTFISGYHIWKDSTTLGPDGDYISNPPYSFNSLGVLGGTVSSEMAELPMMIQPGESTNASTPIPHAICGPVGQIWAARVFPATARDAGILTSTSLGVGTGTGILPFGALVQLDPSLNLAGLTLTLPARRILQAWQTYGYYVVDYSGGGNGAIDVYTAVNDSEWVPYGGTYGNGNGVGVQTEIQTVLNTANLYVVAPLTKHP